MCKTYKTKEEAVAAFKKAVEARGVWEEAIRNGISREDVEKKSFFVIRFPVGAGNDGGEHVAGNEKGLKRSVARAGARGGERIGPETYPQRC